jgi:hypothetical protein
MTFIEVSLREKEYARITIKRDFAPDLYFMQDGGGNLIVEIGEMRKRVYDERVGGMRNDAKK